MNVVVDDDVSRRVTVALDNVEALDALRFLAAEYGLTLLQSGSVLRVRMAEGPPPDPPRIELTDGLLSADLQRVPLRDVARRLTEVAGINVVPGAGVEGSVTAFVERAPLLPALRTLFESSGFVLRDRGGVYSVEYTYDTAPSPDEARRSGVFVTATPEGIFDLDVTNADVAQVVREIQRVSPVGVVAYTLPQGERVSVSATGLTLEEALGAVLRGTGASFRREGTVVVVGQLAEDGIVASRLFRMGYISVEGVADLIPPTIREGVEIQTVPTQNGILVTGPNERVSAVESFLQEIDHPPPLVLIEALVVDYLDSEAFEAGLSFGLGPLLDSSNVRLPSGYVLDGVGGGAYEASGDGDDATAILQGLGRLVGIQNIGRLPADFYYRIRALEQEGRVNVRSRPQVSTLNGVTATISIGTTQYFILRSTTPIGVGGDNVITQETERFERIDANVSLRVTPYVSPSGEVTVALKPEFSQPVGEFRPGVPPTISTRTIESTVRLRDGETIVLGGLIEEREVVNHNRVPILGDIPLLGLLFRSRTREIRRSELVIYLTPHVFYGEAGEDAARWRAVSERMGIREPQAPEPAPEEPGEDGRSWGRDE